MELEDWLYRADVALCDENAGEAARRQHPDREELAKLVKDAHKAVRLIYNWMFDNTSRRCP